MSSSGGRHKKSNKKSSSSSSSYTQYPTGWSEWEWNVGRVCWQRYRYKAPDDYEVEYQVSENSNQNSSEPRDAKNLSSIPEGGDTYQTSENYTTSVNAAVETVTSKFSQLTTTPVPLSYYNSDSGKLPTPSLSQSSSVPLSTAYSSQSSTQSQSLPNHIRTRNPSTKREEFNPDYKVHKGYEFKWGRVFKVLWAEPKGQGGQASGEDSDASYTQRQHRDGTTQFQKVRRFIIVSEMNGHCICLPINTYSQQGVTKNGVHAEHHTIVYSRDKPHYIHGEKEKGLTKKPIKIVCNARHSLDERSRLNYAKTYTVEHNVKVCFIGKIDKKSEWYLTADFNNTHPPLQHRGPEPVDDEAVSHAEGGSSTYDYSTNTGLARTGQASPSTSLSYNMQSFSPGHRALFDIEDGQEEEANDYDQNGPEHPGDDHSGDEHHYEADHDEIALDSQVGGSHHAESSKHYV